MRSLSRTTMTIMVACGALAGALLSATPALANIGHGYSSSFGGTGTGPGQLNEPSGIAVNDATGTIYVLDQGNNRIEEFTSTGTLTGEFNGSETPAKAFTLENVPISVRGDQGTAPLGGGIAIDNSCYLRKLSEPQCKEEDPSDGDVYVTDTGHDRVVDKFEADGKYVGQIDERGEVGTAEREAEEEFGLYKPIYGVSVDANGTVWVDEHPLIGGSKPSEGQVKEYSNGLVNSLVGSPRNIVGGDGYAPGLAFGTEGNFYAMTSDYGVQKFNNNGESVGYFGEPLGEGYIRATGIAVDLANNDAYVDEGTSVEVLAPDGTVSQEHAGLGYLNAGSGVGVDSADNTLYVVERTGDDVVVLTPGPTPAAPETLAASEIKQKTAVLKGKLGSTLKYYFEYKQGTECKNGKRTSVKEANGEVSVEVTGLEPAAEYSYCLVAENQYGPTRGGIESLTTQGEKPEIVSVSATTVGEILEGEFKAKINPNNEETTYTFEYSTEANLATETLEGSVGTGGGTIPAGIFGAQTLSVAAEEEEYAATYYYRVTATNTTGTTVSKIEAYTKIPIVDSESASELTLTSAIFGVVLDDEFVNTKYYFEYATSKETIESEKGIRSAGGEVGQSEMIEASNSIGGLTPYTLYYYRVIAENKSTKNLGNADKGKPVLGNIETFTTRSLGLPTTGEALSVTRTTAALSGSVIAPFAPVTYYYEYVNDTYYQAALAKHASNPYAEGETTVPVSLSPSETPQAAGPIQAGGLLPETTYDYRLVAKNQFGWNYGADRTFRTPAKVLPTISTGAASAISQNGATISGTVGTNGLQTEYGFEIGTEPGNYGAPTGLGTIGGSLTEAVSVTLGELQPGTTYYYRLIATNDDGTVYSQPVMFATPGFPVLLTPQSELPEISFPSVAFPTTSQENTGTVKTKTLTKAQKLANALKECKKDKSKQKRASCEKRAHEKYGVTTKRKRK